jgi:hypothetical protein
MIRRGAVAASVYGSTKIMRLLVAPAPHHWLNGLYNSVFLSKIIRNKLQKPQLLLLNDACGACDQDLKYQIRPN